MIDTYEKLVSVVDEHKNKIVARAMDEYVQTGDDDVWGTFSFGEEEIDFNIYKQEDDDAITIWAYALKSVPDEAPYVKQVNTEIGVFVAYVDYMEA